MATLLGSLLVSLGLESGEFKSGLSAAEKEMRRSVARIEKAGKGLQGLGRNLTLGLTAPLTALGVASFKAASDAAELESAFGQTFGNLTADMKQWAVATGDAMGRSTQEIQNAANSFGIFFNQAAPTRQAAADLAKQFSVLAQDLSSFFNVSPDVALQKLRSGLSGESEPLRDFGVFLNEAAVGQKALQLGLAKTTKELTDQDKILARAALIMEATASAQGDVARTADGTANRIRAARAAFEELSVAIGQKLIPALTPLITGLTNALNAFNNLSPGMQTAIVGAAGLAAALGPMLFVIGGITKGLAPLIAAFGTAATVAAEAGVATTGLSVALTGLRSVLAPVAIAVGALTVIMLAFSGATDKATKSQEDHADATKTAAKFQERLNDVLSKDPSAKNAKDIQELAKAHRDAAAAAYHHERAELAIQRANAISTLNLARQGYQDVTRTRYRTVGNSRRRERVEVTERERIPSRPDGRYRGGKSPQQQAVEDAQKDLEVINQSLDALAHAYRKALADGPAPLAAEGEKPKGDADGKKTKATGPTTTEIEARFQNELIGYTQQTLSARQRTARSADEQAELELRSVEWARRQTLEQIAADKDYNAAQKAALVEQVERLAEVERAAIEFQRSADQEREAADLADQRFTVERDSLQNAAALADTDRERKRFALDILALEQAYRRSKLEAVIASETATDAEKQRAQVLLDSLAALDAGERAAASRANETQVEAYLRGLNKTPEQFNEAIDDIKIGGLNALNDGLAEAIVNFRSLGDVARGVLQQILADLVRLQIQQAIIKPLAGALGLGGGGFNLGSIFGGAGSSLSGALSTASSNVANLANNLVIPGFAKGTNFAPGGLAMVGERGPELVDLPRGSRVFPNEELAAMGGVTQQVHKPTFIFPGITDARAAREAGGQAARRYRRELTPMKGM